MKLYLRYIIEYDFRRVGYENCTFDSYSLIPFDKTETPLDGVYHYTEYDLFDLFTKEEAIELAKEMEKSSESNSSIYDRAIKNKLKKNS